MGLTEKNGLYRRFNRVWHVLVAVASLTVGYLVMQQNGSEGKHGKHSFVFGECFVNSILFITSIAINFGFSLWMTFVAGPVLYKSVPTHTFGYVQSKLFPFYFLIKAVTGLTMFLIAICSSQNVAGLTKEQKCVLVSTAAMFLTSVCNGIFAGPRSTAIMFEKHRMEKEATDKDKLENDEEYKAIKRRFGKVHGISALLNMISLGGGCYLLYWISMLLHELSSL